MLLKALIVEQLEENGTLRSLKMQPGKGHELVVAFGDEYDEPRAGPFHFYDHRDEQRFAKGFAQCKARQLGQRSFTKSDKIYHAEISWYGIPTQARWLSYYALSLPKCAIPTRVSIADPHVPGKEYRRYVARDDSRQRFVIYLECSSSLGRFDFDLSVDFVVERDQFPNSAYTDAKTFEGGRVGDDWKYLIDKSQVNKVQQFFVYLGDQYSGEKVGAMGPHAHMGDRYTAGQVGAIGPNSTVSGTKFEQSWQKDSGQIDLPALAEELRLLRIAMRKDATGSDHDIAIGAIAAAETAARSGDGNSAMKSLRSAGRWTFDVATKIGVGVAVAALKSAMGL